MSQQPDLKQYSYAANSNLVLQADRSMIGKRSNEPTGEAETLWGKINTKEMGSRAKPQKDSKTSKERAQEFEAAEPKRKRQRQGYGDILAATEEFEGLVYRPKTKETRQIYELILSLIQQVLGDVPHDVLRGATDEVVQIMKDENLRDLDKKSKIQEIVGTLSSEKFSTLVNLCKKITDYQASELPQGDVAMDEETGVAVVFEDEEEAESDEYSESEPEEEPVEEGNVEEIEQDAHLSLASTIKRTQTEDSIPIHDIDAFYVQRLISQHFSDAHDTKTKTDAVMTILESNAPPREVENQLVELFEFDKFDLVKILTRNRDVLVWCTRLAKTAPGSEQRKRVEKDLKANGMEWILSSQSQTKEKPSVEKSTEKPTSRVMPHETTVSQNFSKPPKQNLDLDSLMFSQGNHLMSNKKCKLPEGSFKRTKKGWEEIHVPAPVHKPFAEGERLITIEEMPEWSRIGFPNTTSLNRVQSQVYPVAFESDENMLICAPTGAGKTNVAMLTMLHEIGKHLNRDGSIDLNSFKIVYVAPMKALVQEMVGNFGNRLKPFGITVSELTGDRQLTKAQIAETQVIVTTPEKWDIITRKASDKSYTKLVRLIIIDEIHLLHDDRGPVLESLVARQLRNMEATQEVVRLVGLSATLPNYVDVATFLRVDPDRGLFFFDNSYRPCPLKQTYIGITEKKAVKRHQLMNDICYEKVLEEMTKSSSDKNQVLIFTHSRKETARTAKALRDMALENDTIGKLVRQDAASREILTTEAEGTKNQDLKDLLPYGLGIHHAGMSRADRTLVEDLFADGHVQVLVSTATLAWGVNLPAHTVIIKGTQVYNPEKGRWVELSPQDVLQMLGRAGRPQFDTFGEGIILTSHQELQFYLSLLNQQLPIESQFISKLADNLNAEIVLGTVRSRQDAVQWLGYTYLFVRMLRNPRLYGIDPDPDDPYLEQKRIDLIHSAAIILDKCNLIKYDKRTGRFQSQELGRISAYYYVSHTSMATYNQHLKPTMALLDLFRVFSLSDEFKLIPVREEEKLEIQKLMERVPIPVKEAVTEPTAKINVLLQAYISQLKLEGFALMADMVYVTQSAGRILRAMFEVCLKRGWAQLARKALDLCKMVEHKMWLSMNPLRQFGSAIPAEIIKKLERKEFPWERYYDLNSQELGELAGLPKAGKLIHKFVHEFPKLDLAVNVQPITRSLLRVELTITPDFVFDEKVHQGRTEPFWILVEDVDGEVILYHDTFLLKQSYAQEDHYVTFTVPMYEPLPPNYYISVVSDRWLRCESRLPISFKNLILPEKYPPHTELLDLTPLPVVALKNPEFEKLFRHYENFNPIQTQVFPALYNTDENVFVGAPSGSGKTVCAEFALLRLWSTSKERCVYIAPFADVVENKFDDWKRKFASFGKNVLQLTGDATLDAKLMETGDVIFSTPEHWDALSRKWKQRSSIQHVGLFIVDDMHLIGGLIGPTIEVITSRMRFIASQTENPIRIVALSASLANARDLGEWMGCKPNNIFNFHPNVRPVPLEIVIQGYNNPHFASLMMTMSKPCYLAVQDKPSIVFVPGRKEARSTCADLLTFAAADQKQFFNPSNDWESLHSKIQDKALATLMSSGVAYYHEGLSKLDKRLVEQAFALGIIQVIVASRETCWSIRANSHLVVIMGTQYFEGREHRYADYPTTDVLEMMGHASNPIQDEAARCVLMCQSVKKEFYKKFLYEALPVESHLDQFLHDHFNAEIYVRTIENNQDAVDYLTWTFYYRRIVHNPNYYGLKAVDAESLSGHLSTLVETIINDLKQSNCVETDEEGFEVSSLNLGMIAAHYYISYMTVEMFGMSLTENTKLKGLLEIVSAAAEFDQIPIRHHEDQVLKKIYDNCPVKLGQPKFTDPHVKTNILLQAHFSRIGLPVDLESDQKLVLTKVISLLHACVDVISSHGWLAPALNAMELSQMCVQAVWDRDSPLKQIPHFDQEIQDLCKKAGAETVFEVMELSDKVRNKCLASLNPKQVGEVAKFVNRYPSVDLSFELDKEVEAGDSMMLKFKVEREMEDDELPGPVVAPFYPGKKDEGWWIVLGDAKSKTIYAIKRFSLQKQVQTKVEFNAPETGGHYNLTLYLMCDSYAGCDQEYPVDLRVLEEMQE